MNKVANSYWADSRLATQRPAARALSLPSAAELSRELVGTRAEVRRRGGLIPSWVVFTMIMLATFALCLTVTLRTHAQMSTAGQRYSQMNTDVQTLRNSNESLRREVERLRKDPRAIESAARTRLNMVRPNEIVIPVE
ncbi:MAG: septum formation initiator family protein [Acidobacteria bacterium]|nr:septum formation initiator family protein [Acidobacteriota bacterium]MCA1642648.1 septum formation initiator family protein [Acidobacteriota bacterium]